MEKKSKEKKVIVILPNSVLYCIILSPVVLYCIILRYRNKGYRACFVDMIDKMEINNRIDERMDE